MLMVIIVLCFVIIGDIIAWRWKAKCKSYKL